jgi:hypothetical protein
VTATNYTVRGGDLPIVGAAQIGDGDRAALNGLVRQPRTPVRADLAHLELGVEVREVLFHRGLAHDQLAGDLPDRRGFGEQVTREQGTAEHHEHVPLAWSEHRTVRRRLRIGLAQLGSVTEEQAVRADPNLVAVAEPPLRPDALPVEKGPVRRAEISDAPTRGEPITNRVQPAHGGVIERDVVLATLADRHALTDELGSGSPVAGPHLELGLHGTKRTEPKRA